MRGLQPHLARQTVCLKQFQQNVMRHMAVRAMAQSADPTSSFVSQFRLEGSQEGPLAGLTVAVKDLYDIAGHKTGFGSPTWAETHPPATATAAALQALLDAGAVVVGKTHMDELAYSLNGVNAHYGTPVNVAAPGRIPGGSSSGAAAATAAGQAEVGLGSDTGGSVRVPASFCGIFGFRPTLGRVSLEGAQPLAPSYDTVGWFTRDVQLLRKVGHVLLQQQHPSGHTQPLKRWLVAKDAFAMVLPGTSQAIYNALAGNKFQVVQSVLGSPTEINVAEGVNELENQGLGGLEQWVKIFRVTQGYEVWQAHGDWVSQHSPSFGPGIADRFKMAAGITHDQWQEADAKRQRIRQYLHNLLGSDGLLALPTAPGPAVPLDMPADELDNWRKAVLSLTCIAGLAGLPQVQLPIAKDDGLPVGLSFIGPAGSDEQLLDIAVKLLEVLKQ